MCGYALELKSGAFEGGEEAEPGKEVWVRYVCYEAVVIGIVFAVCNEVEECRRCDVDW